jgi:desulfoferrodoxin (superoxide reductase-like protein)
MKTKTYVFIIVLLMLGVRSGFAHPASKVNVDYNLEDQILTVTVEHLTKDVNKHWIDQIVVELNGKEIIQQIFGFQLDQEKQKAVYFIPDVKNGDEIVVISRCNVYGKKKTKIKI